MLIKGLIIFGHLIGVVVYIIGGVWCVKRFLRKNLEDSNPYYMPPGFVRTCACIFTFCFWPAGVVIGTSIGFIRSFLFEKTSKKD